VAVESDGVVEVGEIAADPTALQQIILNLTCNALRHTPAGGTISISTKTMQQSSGKVAVVEFSDTGNGIEPEHLSRIFEPGFSTTGQTPGLGLTVCRRIVEQHAGSIFVSSRSGQGTTFSLEFPAL
jgi:two-component system sensor histidine kinase FlrB